MYDNCGDCWYENICKCSPVNTENGMYCDLFKSAVNKGLKINDVVRLKKSTRAWCATTEKTYIIKHLCNGDVSLKDVENTDNLLYFNFTRNLIPVGHIKECIEFKDKSLCLI